jgi:hypothetical protein
MQGFAPAANHGGTTLMLRFALALVFTLAIASAATAATTVVISGTADVVDSSLYGDDTDGNNGGGDWLHVGLTGSGAVRRAVIRFDTSAINSAAIVSEVTLSLRADADGGTADNHALHSLTSSWVEGTGIGTGTGGGQGGQVVAGSVTWDSREHGTTLWTSGGGDFSPTPSAIIAAPNTCVTGVWTDNTAGDGMVADVQDWIANPGNNLGWLVLGDESATFTARRYISSEQGGVNAPELSITLSTLPAELSVFSVE